MRGKSRSNNNRALLRTGLMLWQVHGLMLRQVHKNHKGACALGQRQLYEPGTGGLETTSAAGTLYAMAKYLVMCLVAQRKYAYVYALLLDPEYGVMDSIYPHAMSQIPTLKKE